MLAIDPQNGALLGGIIVAAISGITAVVVALITNRRTKTTNGDSIGTLASDTNDRVARIEARLARIETHIVNETGGETW